MTVISCRMMFTQEPWRSRKKKYSSVLMKYSNLCFKTPSVESLRFHSGDSSSGDYTANTFPEDVLFRIKIFEFRSNYIVSVSPGFANVYMPNPHSHRTRELFLPPPVEDAFGVEILNLCVHMRGALQTFFKLFFHQQCVCLHSSCSAETHT